MNPSTMITTEMLNREILLTKLRLMKDLIMTNLQTMEINQQDLRQLAIESNDRVALLLSEFLSGETPPPEQEELIITVVDDPEIPDDAQINTIKWERESERRSAWEEPYAFSDFEVEIREEQIWFESLQEADEWMKKRLLRFIRMINMNGKKYIAIKTNTVHGHSLVRYASFRSDYSDKNGYEFLYGDEKHKNWTFTLLKRDADLTYYGYDFIPYNKWEMDPVILGPKNYVEIFNGFNGYPVEAIEPKDVDRSLIRPILDHIRRIWASRDTDSYRWIVSWLAHFVQQPRERLPMITLVNDEGAGVTSLIVEFFIKYMIGQANGITVTDLDSVADRFNGHLEGRGLIYISEIKATASQGFTNKVKRLNQMITDPTLLITNKGFDSRVNTNCSHYIGSTNEDISLETDEYNRRHVTFRTSNEVNGNQSYFKELRRSFTQEVANHLYGYLYGLDLTLYPDPNDFSQEPSLSVPAPIVEPAPDVSTISFYRHLKDGNYIIDLDRNNSRVQIRRDTVAIEKSLFYDLYVSWAKSQGGYVHATPRSFYVALKNIIQETRIGTSRCYVCNKEWFQLT